MAIKNNEPEQAPVKNTRTHVWELVIQDMRDRNNFGIRKYGTALQAFNGRNSAIDAYQEVLDLAVYLRQIVEEHSEMANLLAMCVGYTYANNTSDKEQYAQLITEVTKQIVSGSSPIDVEKVLMEIGK